MSVVSATFRRIKQWFSQRTSADADRLLIAMLLFGFAAVMLRTTWLCDDAYISFRTVDNLASGLGPVWNADERVQGFTNPLWVFLLTAGYLLSHEIFFTSHLLQIALSLTAVLLLVYRIASSRIHAAAALGLLALSKSFMDYTSSGLENALIHAVLAGFYTVYFCSKSPRRLLYLSLLASAGMLARMDTALLFFSPLALEAVSCFRAAKRGPERNREIRALIFGLVPFFLWELFSLFYYGFLFPNTAYSKLSTGIPLSESIEQGFHYLFNSLQRDPLTLTAILFSVGTAVVARSPRRLATAFSVVLYLAYVVRVGGDFMTGRFLSACFFSAAVLLSRTAVSNERRYAALLSVSAVVLSGMVLFPTLNKRYDIMFPNAMDTKGITDPCRSGRFEAGLLETSRKRPLPWNKWIKRGISYKDEVPNCPVLGGVGYTGFYAGPEVHIVDIYGLTEPLLARLPVGHPVQEPVWRIGHFRRQLPAGYLKTLKSGKNVIEDDHLAVYYDKLKLITRGDLFSWDRLEAVVRMNLGFYDDILDTFVSDHPELQLFARDE